MQPAEIVELFLTLSGLFFVLFEVYLNLNDAKNDTTNVLLYNATLGRFLFIPFALGAICGHLFLGTKYQFVSNIPLIHGLDNEFLVVIGIFGICILMYIVSKYIKLRSKLFLSILLLLGLVYGHFFWSMKNKGYTINPKCGIR